MGNNCTICGGTVSFLLKKEEFDLYKCSSCALVFVDPQPTDDFLKEKVYSPEVGYQRYERKDFTTIQADAKTVTVLNYLEKQQPAGKTLLDVGCSSGEFLYHAKKTGFQTKGVEVNPWTVEIGRSNGLDIFNGFLAEAKFNDASFDVIFLGDIIEHVTSPRDFVAECDRLLKPGGLLIISTPNMDCFWSRSTFVLYRLFKIPWSSVTPPHHLFQFSYDNLVLLMKQLQYKPAHQFYMRPPGLVYELSGLHLLKRFKKHKTLSNGFFLAFSFALYIPFYFVDYLITPFKKKDFSMVVVFEKNVKIDV